MRSYQDEAATLEEEMTELNSNSEAVHNKVEAEVENFKYLLRQNHPSFLITCV